MIRLENVSKTFQTKKSKVDALKNISLNVKEGEIYGVIGHSGAGKSTLVRCVNLLERPTEGKVFVGGTELTNLNHRALNESRKKIGMIFQGFNLLQTANVYDNIAIPLKLTGVPKSEIDKRVNKYLKIVGLSDRGESFPAQLSGGQQQRVAIARALAHEPEVLLSDEATSALDPETTDAILDLLLKINETLGVTILLITHEMKVIQKICDHVAVIEDGELVESGTVLDMFTNPKHETTKRFVNSVFDDTVPTELLESLNDEGKTVTLSFVGDSTDEPALAMISKKFSVYPSILSGHITPLKEDSYGRLTVHIQGENEEIEKALHYLEQRDIQIEEVSIEL